MSYVPPAANADDDAHRPRRIGLRPRDPRDGRQRGSARCQMQKMFGGEVSSRTSLSRSLYSITSSARASSDRRHFEAERPGRLQVDDELEFGRLQDRQVGGLRALEDLTGVDADLTIHVQSIGPIAHQPTDFDNLTSWNRPRESAWRAASVANWTRRLVKNPSAATKRASARSRTRVAKAASISRLVLALRT